MKNIDSMTTQELDALVIQADAGHGEKMLTAVYDFLGRFVAYPTEHARVAHSLWIVHAHLMDKWESRHGWRSCPRNRRQERAAHWKFQSYWCPTRFKQ